MRILKEIRTGHDQYADIKSTKEKFTKIFFEMYEESLTKLLTSFSKELTKETYKLFKKDIMDLIKQKDTTEDEKQFYKRELDNYFDMPDSTYYETIFRQIMNDVEGRPVEDAFSKVASDTLKRLGIDY